MILADRPSHLTSMHTFVIFSKISLNLSYWLAPSLVASSRASWIQATEHVFYFALVHNFAFFFSVRWHVIAKKYVSLSRKIQKPIKTPCKYEKWVRSAHGKVFKTPCPNSGGVWNDCFLSQFGHFWSIFLDHVPNVDGLKGSPRNQKSKKSPKIT